VLPTTVESAATAGAAEIAQFYSDQIKLIFSGTDEWIFLVLALGFGFFLASFIFSKSKRDAILIIPFILNSLYTNKPSPALCVASMAFLISVVILCPSVLYFTPLLLCYMFSFYRFFFTVA